MDEVLLAAAQELDRRGWCQGKGRNEDGAVCLFGAIGAVLHPNTYGKGIMVDDDFRDINKHIAPLLSYIEHVMGDASRNYPARGLYYYNDKILETKEEAVKALMEAAEYDGGSEE